jgi:PAS domain S-box-containing protein
MAMTGWVMDDDRTIALEARQDIPIGHKVALRDMAVGDTVVKYGIDMGKVVATAGFWLGLAGWYAICAFLNWLIDRHALMGKKVENTTRLADRRLEQLNLEVAHREREERLSAQLRAIVESSDDAIISKDLCGIIQSWNAAAVEIFGYTAEEMVGNSILIIVPPDRLHEESDIIERIRQGGHVKNFETVRIRKDGSPIVVSLTISPIRDPQGNIVGAGHIARDITERKQFEEQLRQTQKLESLGVLAGGLAHDFNNLLTGLMGNASLALGHVNEANPARARLLDVLEAGKRAALLVRQMLAYAGKSRVVLENLNLSDQVAEIVPLVKGSMSPNIELDLRLAKFLPPVQADLSQMQQLIMNLAINAAEAVNGSQGKVTITTGTREYQTGVLVMLEVRDTGCGMDAETKARIFDPFFTTKFAGRGLGLAAVLGIIRGHRGFITVDSAPGQGSTFRVELPSAITTPAPGPASQQPEIRGAGHILVVDDEEMVRNLAQFSLERLGYTVEMAPEGRSAVDRFAAAPHRFDVVLLDLTMPLMNGEEALHRMQAIRPGVRVILSSGYSETEAMERFGDRSLAGFLQKPYTPSSLAQKIQQTIAAQRVAD